MDLRYKFDEDAQNYEKYRPTYIDELFADIITYSGLDDTKNALEIGIGTGQATLPFLSTGCNLTAIELGENLAAYSKDKFALFDNFSIVNTSFESYSAASNSLNLVYAAY